MDELDLIRTLRADAAPPARAARARAERAWRRAAADDAPRPFRVSPRPRALALATLLAATALGAALLSGSPDRISPAAAALREAADVARSRPAASLPPGAYRYRRTVSVTSFAFAADGPFDGGERREDFAFLSHQRVVQEVWQGRASGRQRLTIGRSELPSARDRRAWEAAGRPSLPPAGTFEDPLGAARPLRLPSDPDALSARLTRRAATRESGRTAAYVFQLAGEALADLSARPAQRAALFEVLARVRGVTAVGVRTDALGRRGLAFAMRDDLDPSRTTLLIDPKTSQLLERTERAARGSAIPAGRVTWIATYGVPRVVERLGPR